MKTKRLLALLLTFVLIFGLAMPAFAQADNGADTVRSLTAKLSEKINAMLSEDDDGFELTGWRLSLVKGALYPFAAVAIFSSYFPSFIASPLSFILFVPLTILLQPLFLIAGIFFIPTSGIFNVPA